MLTRTSKMVPVLFLVILASGACSDDGDAHTAADAALPGADANTKPKNPRVTFGGKRPVTVEAPASYDPGRSHPLVLVLHGYSANGWAQSRLLGYHKLVESEELLLASPEGTTDKSNNQFWNATDACCDRHGAGVDDVSYLTGLIKEIKAEYNVDPRRVYLIGHSNGGFMSFRMACDAADQVAAIISLAGATWGTASSCKPSAPVSVLAIHGDKDDAVLYGGGTMKQQGKSVSYPGAVQTIKLWAGYNKCTGALAATTKTMDLDLLTAGKETTVQRQAGCPKGGALELWTMNAAGHLPVPTADFTAETWRFFKEHPRP